MVRYSLSDIAALDVEIIYRHGYLEFGDAQAEQYHAELHDTFAMLAAFPKIGRERSGLREPVRIQPKSAHVIVYKETQDGVRIVRVLHRSQDWQSIY